MARHAPGAEREQHEGSAWPNDVTFSNFRRRYEAALDHGINSAEAMRVRREYSEYMERQANDGRVHVFKSLDGQGMVSVFKKDGLTFTTDMDRLDPNNPSFYGSTTVTDQYGRMLDPSDPRGARIKNDLQSGIMFRNTDTPIAFHGAGTESQMNSTVGMIGGYFRPMAVMTEAQWNGSYAKQAQDFGRSGFGAGPG